MWLTLESHTDGVWCQPCGLGCISWNGGRTAMRSRGQPGAGCSVEQWAQCQALAVYKGPRSCRRVWLGSKVWTEHLLLP